MVEPSSQLLPYKMTRKLKEHPDSDAPKLAFSSTSGEMDANSAEGLFHGKDEDRRVLIDYRLKEHGFISLMYIQIEGLTPSGITFDGTGSLSNYKGVKYVLTCAHNCMCFGLDGNPIYYTDLTAYNIRKGPYTYTAKYEIDTVIVHPKYDGTT